MAQGRISVLIQIRLHQNPHPQNCLKAVRICKYCLISILFRLSFCFYDRSAVISWTTPRASPATSVITVMAMVSLIICYSCLFAPFPQKSPVTSNIVQSSELTGCRKWSHRIRPLRNRQRDGRPLSEFKTDTYTILSLYRDRCCHNL